MARKPKVQETIHCDNKGDAHLGGANVGTTNCILDIILPVVDSFQPNRKKTKVKVNQVVRRSDRLRDSESTYLVHEVRLPSAYVDAVDRKADDQPGNDHIINSPVSNERNAEEEFVDRVLGTSPPAIVGFQPNRKKVKVKVNRAVRRSDRIRASESTNLVHKVKPPSENVDVVVDRTADDEPVNDNISTSLVCHEGIAEEQFVKIHHPCTMPAAGYTSAKRKVQSLVQDVDELRSQCVKHFNGSPCDGVPTDISYEDMYFDARKKIKALMEEHYELVKKLEFANGRIDVYEKMIKVIGDSDDLTTMEPIPEVISLSPLRKKIVTRSSVQRSNRGRKNGEQLQGTTKTGARSTRQHSVSLRWVPH